MGDPGQILAGSFREAGRNLPGSWPEPSGKLAGSFREAGGNLAGRFEAGFARQCEARTEWAMATGLSENLDFASLGPGETSRALMASVEAGMNSPGGLFPGMKTRLAPSPVGRWIKTLAGNRALPRLLSSPGAIKRVAWGWGGGGEQGRRMTPASGGFCVGATLELKLPSVPTLDARSCFAARAFSFRKAAGLQEPPNRHSERASDAFDGRKPQAFASHRFYILMVPK